MILALLPVQILSFLTCSQWMLTRHTGCFPQLLDLFLGTNRKRFEKGRVLRKNNLKGDWTNLRSVTFEVDQLRQLEKARGFLLVQRAISFPKPNSYSNKHSSWWIVSASQVHLMKKHDKDNDSIKDTDI